MPVDIRFTVIIPHYNIPELLERCLSSIPQREDVQIIVVDDCSEAECVDKIRKVISQNYPNVSFVYQKENGGGGMCRNEALKYAKGRWLVFADADDFFSDDFSQLLDKYKDDDSDIIYFRVGCVFSDDITKVSDLRDHNKARIDEYLLNGDDKILRYLHSEPWGKFVKKELVSRYGIKFSETKVCNDYYFSAISGFHAGAIKADNTPLYFLTVREGSVSSKTDTVEKIKIRIEETVAVEKYLRDRGVCLEDKYRVEKIDMRIIALLKKDFFEGVKEFIYLYRQGIAILPVLGKMLKTFIGNRIR